MIRNLKALGLALVAVLAMSAMAAAGAQGKEPAQVTLEAAEGTIDGTQIGSGTFVRSSRKVTCNEGSFVAHVADGDTTITTTKPTFDSCTGPLGLPATVDMNGCDFGFELEGEEVEGVHKYTAVASLTCNEGGHATITVKNAEGGTVCQYSFTNEGNEGLNTIELTNEAAGEETPKDWGEADINVTGIDSTRTAGSAFVCGPATDENGALEGDWALKGTDGEEQLPTGLTVSTH